MPQNTKASIMESFAKLASRIPIDKITVKDVVDNCGVNRNTFYYYFQDIYALVEDFFSVGIEAESANVFENTWISGFVRAAGFMKNNPRVIKNVYISVGRETFDAFINKSVCIPILEEINKNPANSSLTDADRQTIVAFYGEALLGVLATWLRKDLKRDITDMAREIYCKFGQGISSAVNSCKK